MTPSLEDALDNVYSSFEDCHFALTTNLSQIRSFDVLFIENAKLASKRATAFLDTIGISDSFASNSNLQRQPYSQQQSHETFANEPSFSSVEFDEALRLSNLKLAECQKAMTEFTKNLQKIDVDLNTLEDLVIQQTKYKKPLLTSADSTLRFASMPSFVQNTSTLSQLDGSDATFTCLMTQNENSIVTPKNKNKKNRGRPLQLNEIVGDNEETEDEVGWEGFSPNGTNRKKKTAQKNVSSLEDGVLAGQVFNQISPSSNVPFRMETRQRSRTNTQLREMVLSFPSRIQATASEEQSEDSTLYCICRQVSFGAMVACDGPNCAIEWFHYGCVGLIHPPKGKWFCEFCKQEQVVAVGNESVLMSESWRDGKVRANGRSKKQRDSSMEKTDELTDFRADRMGGLIGSL